MELATSLAACVVGIEMCGEVLTDAVCSHRPYPRVDWEVARERMHTGDLVTARGGVWGDVDALVLRDVSGVLYALTAGRSPVPLANWLRSARGQCCWRPLTMVGQSRRALHHRIGGMLRPGEHPFATLVRVGVLRARASAVDLVNCNTAPGHRFAASIAVTPSTGDLDRV